MVMVVRVSGEHLLEELKLRKCKGEKEGKNEQDRKKRMHLCCWKKQQAKNVHDNREN